MKEFFLKTERLGFSLWNEGDIADAMELWGNPNVTKYIVASGAMSKEQVLERLCKEIENNNKYKMQYWPIYLLESKKNIGCCGLRPYHIENNILEMGIHIKEQYWRQGFAVEGCTAVIDYAFNYLGAKGIFAGHNPKNTASAEMLKKLGFTYTHDEFYKPTGLNHPSYIMKKEGKNG